MILRKPHVLEKYYSSVMDKMLSTNKIAILFDHQYLWKESIDNLDFSYGDNHEGKVAFEATTTFGWVLLVLSLVQSYVGFFDHEYLWKNYQLIS